MLNAIPTSKTCFNYIYLASQGVQQDTNFCKVGGGYGVSLFFGWFGVRWQLGLGGDGVGLIWGWCGGGVGVGLGLT